MSEGAPEPVFEAPWHGQVFALTVYLHGAGHFTWPQWAEAFGATLARHRVDRALNGGEDYFQAWLETLEGILAEKGLAGAEAVNAIRDAWEAAYLNTPHGDPVRL